MTKIVVTAEVRPSEDESKVLTAIANFFDYEKITKEKRGDYIVVIVEESRTLKSLQKFHDALREEKILDVARKYLRRGISDNSISFMLHKQAAAIGVISFVDDERESPLGPISFYIEHKNPNEVVDWLAPRTAKGHPLWENKIPED
ncbi:RNA-binding domain-containing protein [Acidianus ambivalens]|jgi:predicted RNA binding protein with dsRBD fold (UPF0201 family)|uniref:UPF0201 protein D1866_01110 n=1 Tax=Acidianus ambivalens TaxID=2283 RepID=A0A650CSQ8_ACIAM|nr:RNA-binding domain-containing protein [Acidianus ambivalens]MDT7901417.1 RNA-binding domain-containing protein [Acidianus sp.]MQL55231.1 hypothetical protein [Acidianus ambivalens]QGR20775.1 hypothetical protein D1866_01110 [Acidianus ambivalens]